MSLIKSCNNGFLLSAIFICLLIFGGCSGRNVPKIKESSGETIKTDSSYLFNGKTLDGWEIANFGPQGPVRVSGGQIILGMGEGCTGITWKGSFPESGYQIDLDASRIAGNDFFCGITFPVGKSFCSFIVGGWGGATVGLSSINGKDAAENETTTIRNFETGKWYHIRLRVADTNIKSWIDSDKVVDVNLENKKISIRPEVELSKPFGIASWYTTAGIKNIQLRKY